MKKHDVKLQLKEGKKGDKPFVRLFAEPAAIDILKRENVVFSEHVDGLKADAADETIENSGNAGDTTFPI